MQRCDVMTCIHFSFVAPIEGLCCKPKYRANIIHHFIFVFFLYFFYHSSCRKDQFTVLSLKFEAKNGLGREVAVFLSPRVFHA